MPDGFVKKAGEILRSGKPIEDRLREFTAETASHLSGAVASVLLFDRDSEDFFLRATTLRYAPSPEIVHFSSAGTLEELALRERRVVSLSEIGRSSESRLRGDLILFPLIYADEPQGVLAVQSASAGGIAPAQAQILGEAATLLADAVGVSLREESAALRMTKIAAINEAGINIISTLDLQRLLKLVATSACLIMEAESCVIRLRDPQTGKYAIREFYGMKEESDQRDLFRMDTKAVTEILKGAPSLLVRDVAADDKWKEFAGIARTLVCFPLRCDGTVIGTLSIFDKFPHKTFYPASFNGDDVGTLGKFMRYVEKAVNNAIVFERNDRLRNLDDVTGLPTLKYFQDRLLHELSRAKRFKRRLVLMICEAAPLVPGRKSAEPYGGEPIAIRLASVLKKTLREYDVVARISEWKFAMILPEAEDGRMSAIPRIKKAMHAEVDEIRKRVPDIRVDLRFGHASYPEDGDDHEKLIFRSNLLKM
ncbi:MAG: diguanylate cyclase [Deltaproteobacteria bacterium]|nr:diguanylate cyclase [Deltaproteobacteria bacterium]